MHAGTNDGGLKIGAALRPCGLNHPSDGSLVPCPPCVRRRHYLLEARFGLRLSGDAELLGQVAAALRNPRWGIWLGRKSCPPAAPVHLGGPFTTGADCWQALLRAAGSPADAKEDSFPTVAEAAEFADGTDTFNDQPLSFGTVDSSGVEGRQFAPRRVRITPKSPVVPPTTSTYTSTP